MVYYPQHSLSKYQRTTNPIEANVSKRWKEATEAIWDRPLTAQRRRPVLPETSSRNLHWTNSRLVLKLPPVKSEILEVSVNFASTFS